MWTNIAIGLLLFIVAMALGREFIVAYANWKYPYHRD